MEEKSRNYRIRGFQHWRVDSLAEEITKFLNENPSLEVEYIKYSSHGYEKDSKDHDNYSALVICREK